MAKQSDYVKAMNGTMTYREFVAWCNKRACDGCWGMREATICFGVMRAINDVPFWRRKKEWEGLKGYVICGIILPTEEKIRVVNDETTM